MIMNADHAVIPKTYFNNVRMDIIRLLPKIKYSRILEIGGGDFPTLLSLAKEHKAEAYGVDVYQPTSTGFQFIKGSIEDMTVLMQLPDKSFDLIICGDVIEHLVNSEEVFANLTRKLAPGGFIAASIPNIRQIRTFYYLFWRGTFPRWNSGLFDRTHLRWFCRKDVLQIAENTGLSKYKVEGIGRFPFFCYKIPVLSEFIALQFIYIFKKLA
jgi:2-polyprenyl-3-methyl-5-hydroxy-6-metoxy-1,4-benzoquinol methylase